LIFKALPDKKFDYSNTKKDNKTNIKKMIFVFFISADVKLF